MNIETQGHKNIRTMRGRKIMDIPTLKEMISVGAHFGHKKDKTHPRAQKMYTFGVRDGIYIIDLEKTQKMMQTAIEYLSSLIKEEKTILFVGTKRQAQSAVQKMAEALKMPYVNNRWLGGMLTNFETVQIGIKKLNDLEVNKETPLYKNLKKQEKIRYDKNIAKLNLNLGGFKNLSMMPDVLFIFDIVEEDVAVREAKAMNIPIIGVCDTNANPDAIDYVIPINDDSEKTLNLLADAIIKNIKQK